MASALLSTRVVRSRFWESGETNRPNAGVKINNWHVGVKKRGDVSERHVKTGRLILEETQEAEFNFVSFRFAMR